MSVRSRVYRERRLPAERPAAAIVAGLWRNGEQGAWYDPSDLSTMFQDASGTTPVYMPGQGLPDCWIGLQLDKRRGLVRGPELLTNGDFSAGAASWGVSGADATHIATFANGALRYQSDTTSPVLLVTQLLQGGMQIVAGKWYEVIVVVSNWVSGGIKTDTLNGNVASGLWLAQGPGTYRTVGLATSTTSGFTLTRNSTNVDLTIDSISIRELPGNHRWQGTATSRPVLSARYNMYTSTDQWGTAAWEKVAVTWAGGVLIEAANSLARFIAQNVPVVLGQSYTFRFKAKARERSVIQVAGSSGFNTNYRNVNLLTGELGAGTLGVICSPLGGGWFSISVTAPCIETAPFGRFVVAMVASMTSARLESYAGDGVSGVYATDADFRPATDGVGLPPYQRVLDANTYDTVGFPLYRKPDGVDDWMQTATVDYAGADKVTVVAATRKLSDAANQTILESSTAADANTGSFFLRAAAGGNPNYQFYVKSTTGQAWTESAVAAPDSSVMLSEIDFAAGTRKVRRNGALSFSGTFPGGGTLGNYPLYFDRRAGTSLPSGARDYGTLIVGRLLSAPETAAVEKLLRQKSRAY